MRKLSLLFMLLAGLLLSGAAFANPNNEMKSSPLFKASLEQTIAKLEGVVETKEDDMPTGRARCQEKLPTSGEDTCYNTCGSSCGGTCESTCGNTCGSCYTCTSTCSSTCAGSAPTYQAGYCCNANFYGTISWRNTVWNWPSGGSSVWTTNLSPYYALRDYDYWIEGNGGGRVIFDHGSGFNQHIQLALFSSSNGSYNATKAVPNVSQYQIAATMRSYYWPDSWSWYPHGQLQIFNSQPISSRQVSLEIPIGRQ